MRSLKGYSSPFIFTLFSQHSLKAFESALRGCFFCGQLMMRGILVRLRCNFRQRSFPCTCYMLWSFKYSHAVYVLFSFIPDKTPRKSDKAERKLVLLFPGGIVKTIVILILRVYDLRVSLRIGIDQMIIRIGRVCKAVSGQIQICCSSH